MKIALKRALLISIYGLSWWIMTASTTEAQTILVNETFDIGSAPTRFDDQDDPQDVDWWAISPALNPPWNTLSLVTDPGGIDQGNALSIGASPYSRVWGNIRHVDLDKVGDWLRLSFDVRITSPVEHDRGLRFGIYSGDELDNPILGDYMECDIGWKAQGYLVQLGTGNGLNPPVNASIRVYREKTIDEILAPTSEDGYNYTVPRGTYELDPTKHTLSLVLLRTNTGAHQAGIRTSLSIDGVAKSIYTDDGSLTSGTPTDPFGFISSFDGICIGSGSAGPPNFLIDNIVVDTSLNYVPGDANNDGSVDELDAARLSTYWGQSDATWAMGDFSGNGTIDAADASILAANWHYGTVSEGGQSVPEPTALSGLLSIAVGLALMALRRMRSRS